MVRGRRTRATANNDLTSTVAASVDEVTALTRTLNGNIDSGGSTNLLADDQYYASPKRKECKIENVTTNMKYNDNMNSTSNPCHIIKTRSSEQRTIQKYFKTSSKCKEFIESNSKIYLNENIEEENYFNDDDEDDDDDDDDDKNSNKLIDCLKCSGSSILTEEDDDTCDVDYCSDDDDEAEQKQSKLCGLKTKNNSSINNNLFLQEPVLSLNIDKSLNQPSSIIINKTLEVEPIFSASSGMNSTIINNCNIGGYQMNLNGQFNKIVSLNGSPKRSGSSDIESGNGSSSSSSLSIHNNYTINNSIILNMDSNSSDSGVIVDNNNRIELSPNKRRKPTTPHRILCPSPVKHPLLHKSPSINSDLQNGSNNINGRSPGLTKAALKNYTSDTYTITASYLNGAQRRHPKSRRRLNPTHSENNSSIISASKSSSSSPQLVGGVRLTNETLKKLIKNKNNTANNLSQKSVLNSAKNPTAEQNTNNNVKLNHRYNNTTLQQSGPLTNSTANTSATDIKDSVNKIDNNLIIDKQMKPPISTNHRQKNEQQTKITNNNSIISDFFPVRRSVRKTKSAVKEEMMKSLEKAILEEQEDGLKVIEEFEGKGRGIVADRHFARSEFVVEYVGDLINMTEANQREKKYSLDENAGCYMYYFKHKNQQYCIDATAETGKLGRLVNHSRNGNLMTKVVVVKSRPHLVLIAKDNIQPGEELTYDYGDRSKEALLHHPWLAL